MNEFEELAPSNMNYRVHRNVHFLRFNSFFWPNFQHQLYVHCRIDRKMGKVRYYYSNGCHFNFYRNLKDWLRYMLTFLVKVAVVLQAKQFSEKRLQVTITAFIL